MGKGKDNACAGSAMRPTECLSSTRSMTGTVLFVPAGCPWRRRTCRWGTGGNAQALSRGGLWPCARRRPRSEGVLAWALLGMNLQRTPWTEPAINSLVQRSTQSMYDTQPEVIPHFHNTRASSEARLQGCLEGAGGRSASGEQRERGGESDPPGGARSSGAGLLLRGYGLRVTSWAWGLGIGAWS